MFFMIPRGTQHYDDPELVRYWGKLLGDDHVIRIGCGIYRANLAASRAATFSCLS